MMVVWSDRLMVEELAWESTNKLTMDFLMVGEKVDSTAGKWVLWDSKKADLLDMMADLTAEMMDL
jgi:hypothetical protein